MSCRRAFTLVELLTSVAVIAALMAVLLPVLAGIKGSGRSVQCLGNLRQMAIAAHRYALDWNVYPTAVRYEEVGGTVHVIAWDWVSTFDGEELISPGPLWAMTDNPDRVMQCPDYHGPSNFGADPYTGYNYNTSYIGGEAMAPMTGWAIVRTSAAPALCERMATCAIFGCGGYAGGANKFMRAPSSPRGHPLAVTYAGAQAFRHHGHCSNVAFLDGHVASVDRPHRGELATDQLLEKVLQYPENGFLSDDDRAYRPR